MTLLLAANNQSFWHEHGDEISAAITILISIVIAFLVDRLVIGRGTKVAVAMTDGGVSRTTTTRLRLVRRLVFVLILLIGVALALSQFPQIKRLATGILASSAVLGLIIGFAARQSLGNMVAGVVLATSQPIRIGDQVTFEDATGRVDDISLTYTYIDPGDGRLVVVPNERIVTGMIENHSTGDRSAPITVHAWLPPDADFRRAEQALKGAGADSVHLAEWTADGLRVEVKVEADRDRTRVGDEETALRERVQRALHDADLLAREASDRRA